MLRVARIALFAAALGLVACAGDDEAGDSGASDDTSTDTSSDTASDDTGDTAGGDDTVGLGRETGIMGLFQDIGAYPGTVESDDGYFKIDEASGRVTGPIRWGGYSFQQASYLCSWLYSSTGTLVTPCPSCDFAFEVTQSDGVEYDSGGYCDAYRELFWAGNGVEVLDGLQMTWGFQAASSWPDEYGYYAPAAVWYYLAADQEWYPMKGAYAVFTEGVFEPDDLYFYVYWDEGYYYP